MENLTRKLQQPTVQIILSLVLISAFIGGYYLYHQNPTILNQIIPQKEQSNNASGTGNPKYKSNEELTPLTQDWAFFNTDAIVPERRYTVITTQFKIENDPGQIWLTATTQDDATIPIIALIYHPDLVNLDWDVLNEPYYSLYQKEHKFDTIADFLANTPEDATIIADPHLITYEIIKPDRNVINLAEAENIQDADYIFTSFHPPVVEGQFYTFTNAVDASQARIDEANTISWKMDFESTSPENPIYLVGLHVDYRQPGAL